MGEFRVYGFRVYCLGVLGCIIWAHLGFRCLGVYEAMLQGPILIVAFGLGLRMHTVCLSPGPGRQLPLLVAHSPLQPANGNVSKSNSAMLTLNASTPPPGLLGCRPQKE